MQHFVPGTNLTYEGKGGMFSLLRPMIQATDGLTLGQVCSITGLAPATIQNWVKRGFVSHPVQKKYRERQLARILLISALRDCMKIDSIGELMALVNGSANDTGDDIISEEGMYDYLCEVIARTDGKAPDIAAVLQIVGEVIADYRPPHEGAEKRLADALSVMVLAYIAGNYKQEADRRFQSMKED